MGLFYYISIHVIASPEAIGAWQSPGINRTGGMLNMLRLVLKRNILIYQSINGYNTLFPLIIVRALIVEGGLTDHDRAVYGRA